VTIEYLCRFFICYPLPIEIGASCNRVPMIIAVHLPHFSFSFFVFVVSMLGYNQNDANTYGDKMSGRTKFR